MRTRWIPFIAAAALLAGCPEERPEAQKQVPVQRVPPAVSIEPAAGDAGVPAAPPSSDAGAPTR